jgi:hypothetical protein
VLEAGALAEDVESVRTLELFQRQVDASPARWQWPTVELLLEGGPVKDLLGALSLEVMTLEEEQPSLERLDWDDEGGPVGVGSPGLRYTLREPADPATSLVRAFLVREVLGDMLGALLGASVVVNGDKGPGDTVVSSGLEKSRCQVMNASQATAIEGDVRLPSSDFSAEQALEEKAVDLRVHGIVLARDGDGEHGGGFRTPD